METRDPTYGYRHLKFLLYVFIYVFSVCAYERYVSVEVRGECVGVSSCLTPHGPCEGNSGC